MSVAICKPRETLPASSALVKLSLSFDVDAHVVLHVAQFCASEGAYVAFQLLCRTAKDLAFEALPNFVILLVNLIDNDALVISSNSIGV